MDWLTALIVLTGLVILCLWTIVPIREFRGIFTKLRADARRGATDVAKDAGPPP